MAQRPACCGSVLGQRVTGQVARGKDTACVGLDAGPEIAVSDVVFR
jgi:hypothetical protein